jgi:hypothetical protein
LGIEYWVRCGAAVRSVRYTRVKCATDKGNDLCKEKSGRIPDRKACEHIPTSSDAAIERRIGVENMASLNLTSLTCTGPASKCRTSFPDQSCASDCSYSFPAHPRCYVAVGAGGPSPAPASLFFLSKFAVVSAAAAAGAGAGADVLPSPPAGSFAGAGAGAGSGAGVASAVVDG